MIRAATLADLDQFAEVIRAAYAPAIARGLKLPLVDQGLAEDLLDNHVWVAVNGDIVLGGVVLVLGDERAYLANLAVDPRASGKGLGKQLVDVAAAATRSAGFRQLSLTTRRDMTSTLAFYKRIGWIQTGNTGTKIYLSVTL